MIIDFLQDALQKLRPDNSSWYTFAKTDSNGETIPDNDRMQTKFVIVNDDYKGKVTRPTDKEIDDKITELKSEYDSKSYARAREPQYPSIEDVVVALAEKQEGNDTMWKEITALRQKVKSDIPKPT